MGLVLCDAVAMEGVAGGDHFPGQPAGGQGLVAGEEEGEVAWLATAAALVVRDRLRDGLHLSLVAVGTWREREREGERERERERESSNINPLRERLTSELQAPQLKGHKPVPDLDDVDQSVEPVGSEDKEVARRDSPPPPQEEVSTQALLQDPGEVLVEEAVQLVRVWVPETALQLGDQPRVAGV